MHVLELIAAFVLAALFALGVFDLGLSTVRLVTTGRYTEPDVIVHLIDAALLLFIIVEVFHTVVAYSQDRKVTRIVIDTGLIAVTRKVIVFHPGDFETVTNALMTAVSYAVLLVVLIGGYFVVRYPDVADAPPEE